MANISKSIFRAYDIRGTYPSTLNEEAVIQIGKALGTEALALQEKSIYVGRDGRNSSPGLAQALCQGILSTGCNVIDVGLVPTPLLYFASKIGESHSGVMVTGSHNPPQDNGLKMVLAGKTLIEDNITRLYERLMQGDFAQGQGKYSIISNIPELYLQRVTSEIQIKKPLKIVIDCSNGASGEIAPQLFRRLGCEVIEVNTHIDGNFPAHLPDPSQPENYTDLIQAVKKHQADLGLIFDGDADRLGIVTYEGEIIWPDRQMILFAKKVIEENPGATIIFDVKSSRHLTTAIENAGGQALMWKTGHSLIKAKMEEANAKLAGEMSGHIFFRDRWYGFDDGLYSGARLLEILDHDSRSASEVFASLPESYNTPELRLQIAEEEKANCMKKLHETAEQFFPGASICRLDGLRIEFPESWGLIRQSNTSPCLTIRFEADHESGLSTMKQKFREWILSIAPQYQVPF